MRIVAAVLFLTCALKAQPSIVELQPRGAQKGKAFSLTVVGQNLGEGVSVISNLPASFTSMASEKRERRRFWWNPKRSGRSACIRFA